MINIIDYDMKISAVSTNVKKITPIKDTQVSQDMPYRGKGVPAGAARNEHRDSPQKEMSAEELKEVVESLNEHIKSIKRELHFSIDKDSGETVIKVIDSTTDEVIRQIPNEEAVKSARKLIEGTELHLLNEYS